MIRLEQPVIVEGKYDKITLENIIDGLIITTNGFGIFKDKEKCRLIKRLAREKGIVIMTDSDSAGSVIRGYLKGIVGDAPIINVYVPCLKGKERRKSAPSKEGFLGVEGMTAEVIENALRRSGVTSFATTVPKKEITKTHLYEAGLSGRGDSSRKRRAFLSFLDLPQGLTTNAMLDILNTTMNYEEFKGAVEQWLHSQQKS